MGRDGRPELWVARVGRLPYREALELQQRVRERRQREELPDSLLLVEHPPVYTKGRRSRPEDLPMGEDWYRLQGIEVEETDRGGRVTYHGPGQLVGYPIMRLGGGGEGRRMDVPTFVETLERALIAALADEGIEAAVRERLTGVWAGEAKIGSIGLHVSRGVTTHGFAINVDNDLQPFEWIVPCGLEHVRVTSVYKETRRLGAMDCFRRRIAHRVAEAFGRRQRLVSARRLAADVRDRREPVSA